MKDYAIIPVTYNDETHTLQDWAKIFGLEYQVVSKRYQRGIRGADLFKQPRTYKKRKEGLPTHMTRTEALLLGLDDYDRDHVLYYSAQLNIPPTEFVNKALNHAFNKIHKALASQTTA